MHGPKQLMSVLLWVLWAAGGEVGRSLGVARWGGGSGRQREPRESQRDAKGHLSEEPFLSQEWAPPGIPCHSQSLVGVACGGVALGLCEGHGFHLQLSEIQELCFHGCHSVMKTTYDRVLCLMTITAPPHSKMTLKIYSSRCYKMELNVYFKLMASSSALC